MADKINSRIFLMLSV